MTPDYYPLRLCLVLAGTADVARGSHDRALERLSAARDEMNRQAVALDWHRRMQLESSLAELWIARQDLSLARPQAQRFLDATLSTEERTWQALAWKQARASPLSNRGRNVQRSASQRRCRRYRVSKHRWPPGACTQRPRRSTIARRTGNWRNIIEI